MYTHIILYENIIIKCYFDKKNWEQRKISYLWVPKRGNPHANPHCRMKLTSLPQTDASSAEYEQRTTHDATIHQ
jgi:hypothetical protein